MNIYSKIGLAAPEILLPDDGTDMTKWAVIACDQYTSEPDYWTNAEEIVGDAPSTLRLILPEYYLPVETEEQKAKRLEDIKKSAEEYLNGNVFRKLGPGYILTDRLTSLHPSRKGLVIAIDLETYSFRPEDKALIRATEGTVLERIPPRVMIRSNSPIELPHVMLLIDDPTGNVIERAWAEARRTGIEPVYDTDLMQDCGHIKGVYISDDSEIAEDIRKALEEILDAGGDGLLYLVGDGNHSLASAKAYWEQVRETLPEDQRNDHPARFALVEVVNIHDKGLDFEPIHRVVFDVSFEKFIGLVKDAAGEENVKVSDEPSGEGQRFTVVSEGAPDKYVSIIANAPHSLAVGSVQQIIDKAGLGVDYIHGEDSVRKLAIGNNIGILLPEISKDSFFETVARDGVFPRKTFSMGEAFEKRFYLEARVIR